MSEEDNLKEDYLLFKSEMRERNRYVLFICFSLKKKISLATANYLVVDVGGSSGNWVEMENLNDWIII